LWPYDEEASAAAGQPVGYTMEMLDRLRMKAGESAWARNFMQNPIVVGERTFTDTHIRAMCNPLRTFDDPAPGGLGVVTVDPALGGYNVVEAMVFHDSKLKLVAGVEDHKLTTNEQIINRVEEMILRIEGAARNIHVNYVVVEANAFQKGLASDRQLLDLQDRYGFSIRSHLTGDNKYDESIGLASMARDCRLGLIEVPYSEDQRTRHWIDELISQMKRWRPNVPGARLRQDRLMALWFGWILWRELNGGENVSTDQFNFSGLNYSPTRTGLLTPQR